MLKIQVLGKGLIPRGYGLAPRLNPFPADMILIGTILNTYGLSVNYLNPDDNNMHPLTKENLKKIYNKYGMGNNNITTSKQNVVNNGTPKEEVPATGISTPSAATTSSVNPTAAPVVPPTNNLNPEEKKEENKVEEKTNETVAPVNNEKKDEKKEENNAGSLKPINAPDNNQNQNKQQQFNKNGNNNNKK